ncbi:MAG TPA: alpha/beta hydrolase [Xanthobacteraceae bacterium]|nr:alpha/beta hydrolase [Xanthobacteraceae bacterium]
MQSLLVERLGLHLKPPFCSLLFRTLVQTVVFALALTLLGGAACADPLVRVYAIRGFVGIVFSRGMNQLCDELNKLPQVMCEVEDFHSEAEIEHEASIAFGQAQKVVLVGHSWGAHAALKIAATIPGSVPLVVTIDPNWFPEPPIVPNNVEVVLNYYQDFDMLGRAALTTAPGYAGSLVQILRNEPHVMIDASPAIHAEIMNRIKDIVAKLEPRPNKPARAPAKIDNSKRH